MCKCRKLISLCLISIFLFLALTVPSFAYTNGNLIQSQNLNLWSTYQSDTSSYLSITFDSDTLENIVYIQGGSGVLDGNNGYLSLTYTLFEVESLKLKHEYSFSFDFWRRFSSDSYQVSASLLLLNGSNGIVSRYNLYTLPTTQQSYNSYSFNFVPEQVFGSSVQTGYKIAVSFNWYGGANNSTGSRPYYKIKNIALIDNDDNSGFLNTIINGIALVVVKIEDLGSTIVSGISSALTTVKNGIVSAIGNIQGWLTDVKNGIVDKLQNVLTNLQNKLDFVKTAITDKLENVKTAIGDFFTMLKNYLLYFKHPVTLNNDGVPVDSQGNPVYENPFEEPEIFETLDDWVETIDEAKETTEDSADEGLSHISGVMGIITTLFTRVPFLSIFFGFVLAVVIIKKVTGR